MFSCCLNTYGNGENCKCSKCSRCKGLKRDGTRCSLRTCIDSEYCHHHLKSNYNVVINLSRVPNGGLGLFAMTSKNVGQQERDLGHPPVFRRDDVIVPYGGRSLTNATFESIYDYTDERGRHVENAGPYAIQGENNRTHDAMCRRRAGAYMNDVRGSGMRKNAKLRNDGNVIATADIFKGDEILTNYGAGYWTGSDRIRHESKNVRADSRIALRGRRGTYVLADGRRI